MASGKYFVGRSNYGTFKMLATELAISRPFRDGRHWEEHHLAFILPLLPSGEAVVIDGGSHVGTHSIPYASRARHVYSFDAQPEMWEIFLSNIAENKAYRIIPHCVALGHRDDISTSISAMITDGEYNGTRLDYDQKRMLNYAGMQIGEGGDHKVPMRTIDSLNLYRLDFMKIDIEGSEPLAFFGARQTIRRHRPVILFESNCKVITAEMRRSLSIPLEVENFSITKFCDELDYHRIHPASYDGDYYLFPRHRKLYDFLLANPRWRQVFPEGGDWEFSERGGSLVVTGTVGGVTNPYICFTLSNNRLRVIFGDYISNFHDGSFRGNSADDTTIIFDSGAVWRRQSDIETPSVVELSSSDDES